MENQVFNPNQIIGSGEQGNNEPTTQSINPNTTQANVPPIPSGEIQPNQPKNKNKLSESVYLLGYFILGGIYLFINAIPLPLGFIAGVIRIYRMYKKDGSFSWKFRLILLIIGAILGSSLFPIFMGIHLSLSWPAK